ncbi:brain and acute leukemia cytoplasmic protein isoform X2 [Gallus gallus]|uniref:brain and acute leukemia cytoplasmic protein isoform X2 n=1 Tax=Gallus gallus TaxID=9031 RepID=UPI001F018DDD|nr:brain and acute leukemia cytoplasmic protein isoform X2 [Gallus gallus]
MQAARSGLEDAAGLRRCAPELPLWECVQGPDSPARLCAGRAPCLGCFGILEDGKSTQTGGTATPATTGILSTEKRTISGAQCVNAAGAGPPRQSSFRAAESKWDTQKMSTKEVTINVSKTIRPSDRRITKNCVN